MDGEEIIKVCIENLIDLYVGEIVDGGFYCVLYDVIIKCIFFVVVKNYMMLFFEECDVIFLFDCIWLKLFIEKVKERGDNVYDYGDLKIVIFIEFFIEIVKLIFKRKVIMEVWNDIILLIDKDF